MNRTVRVLVLTAVVTCLAVISLLDLRDRDRQDASRSITPRAVVRIDPDAPPLDPTSHVRVPVPPHPGPADGQIPEPLETTRTRVTVVDGVTGEPVAGASVGIDSDVSQEKHAPRWLPAFSLGTLEQEFDMSLLSGPRGQVQLSFPGARVIACARKGTLFGLAEIRGGSTEQYLYLFEDASLAVRLVTATGVPVPDLPVRLVVHSPNHARHQVLFRGVSDTTSGVIRIDAVRSRIAAAHPRSMATYRVVPDVALDPGPGLILDPRDLPHSVIDLVVSETGQVSVTVLDEYGRPYQGEHSVRARWPGEGLDTSLDAVPTADGHLFPFVKTREPLTASVHFPRESGIDRIVVNHEGLTRSGQHLSIEVQVPSLVESRRVLVGRILAPDGSPLARSPIVAVRPPSGRAQVPPRNRESFTTDAAGRFRYVIAPDEINPRLSFCLAHVDPAVRHVQTSRIDIRLPRPEEVGIHDLGDLTLIDVPRVVAGRVEDESGKPVRGAWVIANLRADQQPAFQASVSGASVGTRGELMFEAITSLDGSFSIHAEHLVGEGEINVISPGRMHVLDFPFRVGQQDLRIEMEEGARFRGSLLLDPFVLPRRLRLKLSGPSRESVLVGRDSRFDERRLIPGTYTVEVRLRDDDSLIYSQPHELEPSMEGHDRDPATIDLRGLIYRFGVSVTNVQGSPIPGARVRPAAPGSPWLRTDPYGRGTLLRREANLQAIVFADDYRLQRIPLAAGENRVTLERGIPIRLEITAPTMAVPDHVRPFARLRASHPGGPPGAEDPDLPFEHRFIVQNALSWAVPRSGRYEIVFGGEIRRTSGRKDLVGIPLSREITVSEDTGTEQVFRLEISESELRDALQNPGPPR